MSARAFALVVAAAMLLGMACAAEVAAAERASAPAGMDFSGPREAWQRLASALRRGDKAAAMKELTPGAQERHEKTIDEWLQSKPFDEKSFGKVRAVTLSGAQYATVNLTRVKNGATHSSDAMMMRGHDGRWRIDRLPPVKIGD